ncbi:hypothetical protein EJD97_020319, partial [Solanum chilense]
RNTAQRLHKEIVNLGVPPRNNQVPPLEEVANDGQAPSSPLALTDGDIRVAFLQMAQAITIQTQAVTTQAEVMTTQSNQEVVPGRNQHVRTMASRLRDFTRMDTLLYMGPK